MLLLYQNRVRTHGPLPNIFVNKLSPSITPWLLLRNRCRETWKDEPSEYDRLCRLWDNRFCLPAGCGSRSLCWCWVFRTSAQWRTPQMHIFVNGWFCIQNSMVFRRFLTAFVQPCHSSAPPALIRRSFVCNRPFTWVLDKPKSKFYIYVGVTLLWLSQFLPQRVFQCGPSRRLHGRRG